MSVLDMLGKAVSRLSIDGESEHHMTGITTTFTLGGDLRMRRLGFGAMRILGDGFWGPPADIDATLGLLRRAAELGIDHIDTADSYGPDISERLIHDALHPYGSLTVASKAGLLRTGPASDVPPVCGRPDYLIQQLHKTLRNLQVDQLDLWYLHRIDPEVPAEDQFGALAQAREQGLVRHVGLSEVSIEELEAARRIVPIAAVQNFFNLTNQDSADVLEHCEAHDIAFVPFFPLAMGELAGVDSPLRDIAADHDATVGQVTIAWLLHRSPNMLPIPGTSSIEHLEENVAALELELSDEDMQAIDGLATSAA